MVHFQMVIIDLRQKQGENVYYSILFHIEHEFVSHHTWITTRLVHPMQRTPHCPLSTATTHIASRCASSGGQSRFE